MGFLKRLLKSRQQSKGEALIAKAIVSGDLTELHQHGFVSTRKLYMLSEVAYRRHYGTELHSMLSTSESLGISISLPVTARINVDTSAVDLVLAKADSAIARVDQIIKAFSG